MSANCGKGEDESVILKACTTCKLVKYCGRDCQIAHRSQHKKSCKKRASEFYMMKLCSKSILHLKSVQSASFPCQDSYKKGSGHAVASLFVVGVHMQWLLLSQRGERLTFAHFVGSPHPVRPKRNTKKLKALNALFFISRKQKNIIFVKYKKWNEKLNNIL